MNKIQLRFDSYVEHTQHVQVRGDSIGSTDRLASGLINRKKRDNITHFIQQRPFVFNWPINWMSDRLSKDKTSLYTRRLYSHQPKQQLTAAVTAEFNI